MHLILSACFNCTESTRKEQIPNLLFEYSFTSFNSCAKAGILLNFFVQRGTKLHHTCSTNKWPISGFFLKPLEHSCSKLAVMMFLTSHNFTSVENLEAVSELAISAIDR